MAAEPNKQQKKKTNKRFIIVFSIMILAGLIIGGYVYIHSQYHTTTNDAQIKSDMVPIIPHVSGYVNKVYVTDNQFVKKGDTLFTIDPKDYEVQLTTAEANLAMAESRLSVAKASIGASHASYLASKSQVSSSIGSIKTAEIRLRRATKDYQRFKNLYDDHSITAQRYEKALAAKQRAEQQLKIMKDQKKASLSQSDAAGSHTKTIRKKVAVAKAQIKVAKAQVKAAKLNIGYTTVVAPISGQLSAVDLQPGQFVAPGQSLFFLVNSTKKWVVANFKETQVTHIKKGQVVEINVDAFPDVKFKGRVSSISPATGARFALLPPDNATGNFVKTVQRLPVKIILTDENKPEDLAKLRSGMNAEADIHIK